MCSTCANSLSYTLNNLCSVCHSSIKLLFKEGIQLGEEAGLSDLANKNMKCRVKSEFLIDVQRIIFFFNPKSLPAIFAFYLATLRGTSYPHPLLTGKT